MRKCQDCGMDYQPKARNQKRCAPCGTLRNAEYWDGRGVRSSEDQIATDLVAGPCDVCSAASAVLVAGAAACRECLASPDSRRHQAALEELRTAFDNRKQYAAMPADPQIPARGSAAYEVLTRQVWAADIGPEEVAAAETVLRSVVGDAPLPRYLVLCAARQFVYPEKGVPATP